MKRLTAQLMAIIAALAWASAGAAPTGEAPKEVVFTAYTPLSSDAEIMRRNLTPLDVIEQLGQNSHGGGVLPDQAIDLSQETFVVYVPAQRPPGGYALMVFVPPWDDAEVPRGWAPMLDQYGVILVSAARSGNEADTPNRRIPLAVLAAQNVIKLYPVDTSRVYVAGLSGGSKVAMRLSLAYPDLFRGAILNAGSLTIGDAGAAVPPRDLLYQFQTSSRLVYVTGADDDPNLATDSASQDSMHAFCMFNLESETLPGVGHDLASAAAVAQALKSLAQPIRSDPAKLARCRAKIDSELEAKLGRVGALVAGGKRDEAKSALAEIDRHFGGLAAPRSTDLAQQLATAPR